jgi:hypothetical protein
MQPDPRDVVAQRPGLAEGERQGVPADAPPHRFGHQPERQDLDLWRPIGQHEDADALALVSDPPPVQIVLLEFAFPPLVSAPQARPAMRGTDADLQRPDQIPVGERLERYVRGDAPRT